jgi:hypothetical protein
VLCNAPMARVYIWWQAILGNLGIENAWVKLITGTIITYGPSCFIAVGTYSLLTRYFVPKTQLDKETHCRKCGYTLKGITEPRCPECGEKI